MIERCWSQDLKLRPTFDEIVEELADNEDFLDDTIDVNEYNSFIEHINNCKSIFESQKKIITIDQLNKITLKLLKI